MKYVKVHYLDFFDKIGQQISNTYPHPDIPKFKNYTLLQFGKNLMSFKEKDFTGDWTASSPLINESYLLLFKFDFTKGNLPEGQSKLEYLKSDKEEFFDFIANAFRHLMRPNESFRNIYLMEDLSAKTEYYTLEFRESD